MIQILLCILALILCLLLSGFFSASEMSLSSVNEIRMENMAEKGDKKARKVLSVIENFENALSSILIGNNLVNIASSTLGSVLVILLTGSDELAWVSTAVITVLVIIFGETVPKITAKKNANRMALFVAGPVSVLTRVLKPVIFVVTSLIRVLTKNIREEEEEETEEDTALEMASLIETAEDEGVLDEDSSELMQNVIDFPLSTAQEAMTSRVDMEAIDIDDGIRGVMEVIDHTPYSRIPVYEESIDNIIGILHVNRFFKALADAPSPEEIDLRSILMPPVYVYKTMDLPIVLRKMRAEKQHLAVVTDEYAGTEGIITLEDVLEEIVGEIWDETDTVEVEMEEVAPGRFLLDGDMPIGDFLDEFDLSEEEFDFDSETLGGFVIEYLEDFPKEGDAFTYENCRFTVTETDGRRVSRVQVEKEKDED